MNEASALVGQSEFVGAFVLVLDQGALQIYQHAVCNGCVGVQRAEGLPNLGPLCDAFDFHAWRTYSGTLHIESRLQSCINSATGVYQDSYASPVAWAPA